MTTRAGFWRDFFDRQAPEDTPEPDLPPHASRCAQHGILHRGPCCYCAHFATSPPEINARLKLAGERKRVERADRQRNRILIQQQASKLLASGISKAETARRLGISRRWMCMVIEGD